MTTTAVIIAVIVVALAVVAVVIVRARRRGAQAGERMGLPPLGTLAGDPVTESTTPPRGQTPTATAHPAAVRSDATDSSKPRAGR